MRFLVSVDRLLLSICSRIYRATHADEVVIQTDESLSDGKLKSLLRGETPILLKGGAKDWPAIREWKYESLKAKLTGTIGVGCSTTTAFKTGVVPIISMDIGDVLDRILGGVDDGCRYYLKNILMQNTCLAPLVDDLGPIRLLPKDARDKNGQSPMPLLWMGQESTNTPLHFDASPNVIALISGRKALTLVSPGWSKYLHPELITSRTYWYSRLGTLSSEEIGRFPSFRLARVHRVSMEAGDMLFIPAGWWHHVENMSSSISVNFFFRSALWTPLRRLLNPNVWHAKLAAPVAMWRLAQLLRKGGVGPGAEEFDVYINTHTLDHLRETFWMYKKSWNPLFWWALAPYGDFETTSFYQRHKSCAKTSPMV